MFFLQMGESLGWHAPFYAISAIGILGLIGIIFFIPHRLTVPPTHLSKEISALISPDIGLALLVKVLGFGGLFASFNYIAPLLINVTHFTQSEVAYLLVLFGLGLMIGNFFGGKAADKSPAKISKYPPFNLGKFPCKSDIQSIIINYSYMLCIHFLY